ncbi:hypothetical protein CGC21_11025 [Leishmania donovani]|uniref:Uncharacterized protein n=1 Tax=Leishmania donovani TaxID=5661 RepID=A0A504X8T0_LEIDO|nr:hypothetical protein CGC21_11025 [Leishmania donovani]
MERNKTPVMHHAICAHHTTLPTSSAGKDVMQAALRFAFWKVARWALEHAMQRGEHPPTQGAHSPVNKVPTTRPAEGREVCPHKCGPSKDLLRYSYMARLESVLLHGAAAWSDGAGRQLHEGPSLLRHTYLHPSAAMPGGRLAHLVWGWVHAPHGGVVTTPPQLSRRCAGIDTPRNQEKVTACKYQLACFNITAKLTSLPNRQWPEAPAPTSRIAASATPAREARPASLKAALHDAKY